MNTKIIYIVDIVSYNHYTVINYILNHMKIERNESK